MFSPTVVDGKIIGATIPAYETVPPGFPPLPISPVTNLEFKIEDSNTNTTFDELKNSNNVEINGDITAGINTIIQPIINTNLSVGMNVIGEGIQIGTTITQIIGTTITLSSNATQTLSGGEFIATPNTLAIITIE
jgi:hypothetical protein